MHADSSPAARPAGASDLEWHAFRLEDFRGLVHAAPCRQRNTQVNLSPTNERTPECAVPTMQHIQASTTGYNSSCALNAGELLPAVGPRSQMRFERGLGVLLWCSLFGLLLYL